MALRPDSRRIKLLMNRRHSIIGMLNDLHYAFVERVCAIYSDRPDCQSGESLCPDCRWIKRQKASQCPLFGLVAALLSDCIPHSARIAPFPVWKASIIIGAAYN